ncbi:hypothetical protein BDD43_0634 [Mucilaginibacter gracilis]|uniref:DUF4397 domain-containing protein n=1 Tax=Mucilaginibacter gracilis TaxID=423350 RepID=A0A495IWV0_9SPHI|nr:hypothetical protein [Mucilaginibacter gracilis]RKR80514.1 hypothetical protein BDD43_0634 [Mucilaginibacter gracilis]
MKNMLLRLLVLLFCMTACKKTEETARVRFAQTEFVNATKYAITPYILYKGKKYSGGWVLTSEYGDKSFELYKSNGEKITDFKLTIAGSQKYYIYQPDSTTVPVLLTELPPPPPPPANPLENVTPAPDGYMKIKIKHDLALLGFEKIDVQVWAPNVKGVYELFTTIPNVTTTLSSDFIVIQRPVVNGTQQQNFKFSFLNSVTKAPAMTGDGLIYQTYVNTLTRTSYNVYIVSFSFFESGLPEDFEYKGLFYEIDADLTSK